MSLGIEQAIAIKELRKFIPFVWCAKKPQQKIVEKINSSFSKQLLEVPKTEVKLAIETDEAAT